MHPGTSELKCEKSQLDSVFLFRSILQMPYKRGEILKSAVAFALRKLKIHGRKGAMTEEQRYEAGDVVVYELKRYGDPWRLEEDMPENHPGPSWIDGKPGG
jgi:hypothetical protein